MTRMKITWKTSSLAVIVLAGLGTSGFLAADQAQPPKDGAAKGAATTPAAGAAAAPAPNAAATAKPTGPVPPEAMSGLSFEGLTDDQKQRVVSILNEHGCDCGCNMKLAVCRRDDSKCRRSLAICNQVISLVKEGKTPDEIVKIALSPPSKFVQFPLSAGNAPSVGPADAKVTVLHYYDYQCPFCSRIIPTLDQLAKEYPADVRIVFKQHPLSMHPSAQLAAEAALAANAQGKFFEMHKRLFADQSTVTREKVLGYAKDLGLDVERFRKDLDDHTQKQTAEREGSEVEALGVTGTPASFINGRYLYGAVSYPVLKSMVDEELKWAREGNRPAFTMGKNVKEASTKPPEIPGPDPNKRYDIPVGKAPTVGPAGAKVTILHFYDYQCPTCQKADPPLAQLLKAYPQDVRVAYMQHPLSSIHPQAFIAAEAVMAAQEQGKFAAMHERLIAANGQISRQKILEMAAAIGLDMDRFTKDLDASSHKAEIDKQTEEALKVGANATPSTFINGRFFLGYHPYEALKKVVDEELARPKEGAVTDKGSR